MKRSNNQLPGNKFLIVPAMSAAIWGSATLAQAQYSVEPSWSPMEMLTVSLSANDTLSVKAESTVPTLAINTTSTGGVPSPAATSPASFDPTQPWSVLNGTAFSRRLGWWTSSSGFDTTYASQLSSIASQDNSGNPVSVWIQITGETANGVPVNNFGSVQQTYFISQADNPTGPYTPIFGTAGSSTAWQWDGFMDHNANAVPLADITVPNEVFTETYDVYLGNSAGVDIDPSADTTTTWTWDGPASVPEPTTWGLAAAGLLAVQTFRKTRWFKS
jgi:hypothetical protein